MGALIDHLRALSASGASIEDVTEEAERQLGGGDLLEAELADRAEAIAGASAETDALNEEIRGALRRFPATMSAGFHRTDLDPRAMAVLATLAYARRGGVYMPTDLAEMAERGEIPEEWHAREALRIRVLLVILPMFIAQLERGETIPPQFATAITELAKRLGKVRIPQVAAPQS